MGAAEHRKMIAGTCVYAGWHRGESREGAPQGSVVSPILANLFLHYAFDMWMQRQFAAFPFECYADDAVIHCDSEQRARQLLDMLQQRFAECKLELHPQKTRIDRNSPPTTIG